MAAMLGWFSALLSQVPKNEGPGHPGLVAGSVPRRCRPLDHQREILFLPSQECILYKVATFHPLQGELQCSISIVL